MAAAPLASVLIFRPRAPQVVWGAWLAYLGLLLICAVQFNIIHEARTFWIAIPAFAASLAFWGEHTAETEPSDASGCCP